MEHAAIPSIGLVVTILTAVTLVHISGCQSIEDESPGLLVEDGHTRALASSMLSAGHRQEWNAYYDSASVSFSVAESLFRQIDDWGGVVRSRLHRGIVLREDGDYRAGMDHLVKAESVGRAHIGASDPVMTDVLYHIGYTQVRLSLYERARATFDTLLSRRLTERPVDSTGIGMAYHGLGWILQETGRADQAIEMYNAAIGYYDRTTRRGAFERSRSHNSLGLTLQDRGYLDEAATSYSIAYRLRTGLLRDDHPQIAIVQANRAINNLDAGNAHAGLTEYLAATNIFRKAYGDTHPEVARCYTNLGLFYYSVGDLDNALLHLEQSLSVRKSVLPPSHISLRHTYNALGDLLTQQGSFDEALQLLAVSQNLNDLYVDSTGEAHYDTDILIGRAQALAGDFSSAIRHLTRAVSVARDGSHYNPRLEGEALLALAEAHVGSGQLNLAARTAEESCKMLRENTDTNYPSLLRCSNLRAHVAERQGFPRTAALFFESTLDRLGDTNHDKLGYDQLRSKWSAMMELAGLRCRLNDRQVCREEIPRLQDANALSTYLRKRFEGSRAKMAVVRDTRSSFLVTTRLAANLYRVDRNPSMFEFAFEAAEQSKSGILRDAITETRARKYSHLPDSLLNVEQALRLDLALNSQILLQSDRAASVDAGRTTEGLFSVSQKYDNLISFFEDRYPEYYNLKYSTETASLAEVQEMLSQNEALVEYVVDADSIHIFVISPDEYFLETTIRPDALTVLVRDLRTGITEQEFELFVASARSLYAALITPIEQHIANKDLIVVPDGILHYVPFETLLARPLEASSVLDYRTLPYLVREHAVGYAYSATLIKQLRDRRRQPAERDFLAFAPVFSSQLETDARSAVVFYQNENPQLAVDTPYLPGSLEEVNGIRRAFRRTYTWPNTWFDRKTRILLNDKATEEQVKKTGLAMYKYVHFATHAFVNEDDPDLSGLVLNHASTAGEDGVLHLGEIYNLELNADLVVLSACETGLGQLAAGEGLMGLTRGFLYAGASNVVVSLWKADDVATRDLMVPFYESILSGETNARALRTAKLSLMTKSPRHARPYYWAHFVLMGR